jgi:hypothetical protein
MRFTRAATFDADAPAVAAFAAQAIGVACAKLPIAALRAGSTTVNIGLGTIFDAIGAGWRRIRAYSGATRLAVSADIPAGAAIGGIGLVRVQVDTAIAAKSRLIVRTAIRLSARLWLRRCACAYAN